MKRTFEISYDETTGVVGPSSRMIEDQLRARGAYARANMRVKDVTPDDPAEGSMADMLLKAKAVLDRSPAEMEAVAKAVVAESLGRIRDSLRDNAAPGPVHSALNDEAAKLRTSLEPAEPQSAPAKPWARVTPAPPPAVTSLKIDAHNLKLKLDAINACLEAIKREPKLGETLHFILP